MQMYRSTFSWNKTEVSGQFHAPAALPRGKSPRCPSDRRMCGPQSSSERYGELKIIDCTGTQTTAPWSSRHTALGYSRLWWMFSLLFLNTWGISSPYTLSLNFFWECDKIQISNVVMNQHLINGEIGSRMNEWINAKPLSAVTKFKNTQNYTFLLFHTGVKHGVLN
jgi:hypothetical protein